MKRPTKRQIASSVKAAAANGLAAAAPLKPLDPVRDGVVRASSIVPEETDWLVPGWIHYGGLTVVGGSSGAGKSTLFAGLVSLVTTGRRWLEDGRRPPGIAVYYSVEEMPSRQVGDRLRAAEADMDRVLYGGYDERGRLLRRLALPGDEQVLEDRIRAQQAQLVIMDPLPSFLGPGIARKDGDAVRLVIEGVERVAHATGCAIVASLHDRKGKHGPSIDHFGGAAEWTQVPRQVVRLSSHPQKAGCGLLLCEKGHVGGIPPTLEYTLDRSGEIRVFTLGAQSDLTTKDVTVVSDDPLEIDARAEAREWLATELDSGDVHVKVLQAHALESGISWHTIRSVRKPMGVTIHRVGQPGSWKSVWRLAMRQ